MKVDLSLGKASHLSSGACIIHVAGAYGRAAQVVGSPFRDEWAAGSSVLPQSAVGSQGNAWSAARGTQLRNPASMVRSLGARSTGRVAVIGKAVVV